MAIASLGDGVGFMDVLFAVDVSNCVEYIHHPRPPRAHRQYDAQRTIPNMTTRPILSDDIFLEY
jgi:hypothetical protein